MFTALITLTNLAAVVAYLYSLLTWDAQYPGWHQFYKQWRLIAILDNHLLAQTIGSNAAAYQLHVREAAKIAVPCLTCLASSLWQWTCSIRDSAMQSHTVLVVARG